MLVDPHRTTGRGNDTNTSCLGGKARLLARRRLTFKQTDGLGTGKLDAAALETGRDRTGVLGGAGKQGGYSRCVLRIATPDEPRIANTLLVKSGYLAVLQALRVDDLQRVAGRERNHNPAATGNRVTLGPGRQRTQPRNQQAWPGNCLIHKPFSHRL